MLMFAKPILVEIYKALKELHESGKTHTIYVSKYNLSKEDKELLNEVLRKGNLSVEDDSPSQKAHWEETVISGVWKGAIFDMSQTPVVETIEITTFPFLAASQQEDIKTSIENLKAVLTFTFEK